MFDTLSASGSDRRQGMFARHHARCASHSKLEVCKRPPVVVYRVRCVAARASKDNDCPLCDRDLETESKNLNRMQHRSLRYQARRLRPKSSICQRSSGALGLSANAPVLPSLRPGLPKAMPDRRRWRGQTQRLLDATKQRTVSTAPSATFRASDRG